MKLKDLKPGRELDALVELLRKQDDMIRKLTNQLNEATRIIERKSIRIKSIRSRIKMLGEMKMKERGRWL